AVDHLWTPGGQLARDDFYLCDDSGGVSNNFLLGGTGIRVETTFPVAPDSLMWTPISPAFNMGGGTSTLTGLLANRIYFGAGFTPTERCNITGITILLQNNITGHIQAALYDSTGTGGTPGSFIAQTNVLTNPVGGIAFNSSPDVNFTFTPTPVVAGTK